MTKTTFTNGTPVSPDWFNAVQNIDFNKDSGEELFDGEYYRLTDDALSNEADQIKPQFYGIRDEFLVTAGTGLTVNYKGGVVELEDGSHLSIAPGTVALIDNATNYIYINRAGLVVASTLLPIAAAVLAQVTTVSGSISGGITDLRARRLRVRPRTEYTRFFGGNGSEGDFTAPAGISQLSGEHYYNNFTVPAGSTLQIKGSAALYLSGDFTCDGTITIEPSIQGGASSSFTVEFAGQVGLPLVGSVGGGLSPGGGGNSTGGRVYSPLESPVGSGGGSGNFLIFVPSGVNEVFVYDTGRGGSGGGSLLVEAAGLVRVTGNITANGANATQGSIPLAPTNAASLARLQGNGGGSGGSLTLKSGQKITIGATAILSANGGNGSNAVAAQAGLTQTTLGGGGGGGGWIRFIAPEISSSPSATITVNPGTSGNYAGVTTGPYGMCSGGSFGGIGGYQNGTLTGALSQAGQIETQTLIPN